MTEIILAIITLSVLGYHAWYVREKNKEVSKLVNALVARTPEQYRDLELTDKVKPIDPPVKPKEAEFIPEMDIDDKAFAELIANES